MVDRALYHVKKAMREAKVSNPGDVLWKAVVAYEQEQSEQRAARRMNKIERWEENDSRFPDKDVDTLHRKAHAS